MFFFVFLAKLVFLALSGLALKYATEEREFYNDILVLVQNKKYHEISSVKGWTETLFNVPRILLELLFVLMIFVPTFFSWNFIFSLIYAAAVLVIYSKRPAMLFNRNSVTFLNVGRIVFILLTFIF